MQDWLLTLLSQCFNFSMCMMLLFGCKLAADPLVTLFHSQEVSDVAIWMEDYLLTLLWSCLTLSWYVMLLFGCKTGCWISYDLVPLPASMWYYYLYAWLAANPLTTLSPLSMYVMLLFRCKTGCWPSGGLVLLSVGMWCCYLDARLAADHFTTLSHSQEVCDIVIWM